MTKHTDVLLLVNAMMGQFISGVATRIFIVSMPTIAAALNADINCPIMAFTRSSTSV